MRAKRASRSSSLPSSEPSTKLRLRARPRLSSRATTVAVGQVLCIVEAMKLMNEIESEAAGKIVKILVSNGQPVEYGQPLFKIRTNVNLGPGPARLSSVARRRRSARSI